MVHEEDISQAPMDMLLDVDKVEEEEGAAVQRQCAALVWRVAARLARRAPVACEHSYARVRGAARPHVRALLPRAAPAPAAPPDPLAADPPAPAPPLDRLDPDPPADPDPADPADPADWERAVLEAAPSPAHRRLAAAAVEALADLRLRWLLAGTSRWRREEAVKHAAKRVRRALAVSWAAPGRAPAWLHSTLLTYLPRRERALYDEVGAELRRAVPRLAERLAPRPPAPRGDPLAAAGAAVEAEAAGPWLAWVSAGCARQDERWTRRLGALLHVRVVGGGARAGASPERWCAARAHAARHALAQVLQEAGSRAVVVGGCGAGAALAALVAAGGAQALLLLAPALLTAEGAREVEEAGEGRAVLVVAGGAGAACWRGAAGEAAAGGARRLLLVGGADDALRLPRRLRLRLGLPQHAVDAAVADECARWARHVAAPPDPPPPAEPDLASQESSSSGRGSEILEGCVVSRVSGGTPLPLEAPRRALQAADILRLPVLLAEQLPPAPRPPRPPRPPRAALLLRRRL